MARMTLLEMLTDLRHETRMSANPALNTSARDQQVNLLQRTQTTLWERHDWPHLRIRRQMQLQAGQRYYDPPEELPLDRVEKVEVRWGGEWVPLTYGIPSQLYGLFDSDLDERSWPVEHWQVYEDDQFEVWPVPSDNGTEADLEGYLRLHGIRALNPLVADDDKSDLDGRLIVLFAAAEELAARGSQDAGLKLQAAERLFASHTANASKVKSFSMVPRASRGRMPRGPARVHYRTDETS